MLMKTHERTAPKMVEKKSDTPRAIRGPIISGAQITAARTLAKIRQKQLAEALEISVTALSNLESGLSRAAGERALQIADYFLQEGVMFTGPQAEEIYAIIKSNKTPTGEGVQLIKPDKKLTAGLLPLDP